MVMLNLDKAIAPVSDLGTVDLDVFDQRERAPFTLEERPKRDLIAPSRREGSHHFPLQE